MRALLGISVCTVGTYAAAFRHKSAAAGVECPSYERLEWLGDSVLCLICSRWLAGMFPEANEGDLTKMRTRLVGGSMLSRVAESLGLHRFIETSEKGRRSGWHRSPRILEDVYEALVGAIYTDQGLVAAREFVLASMGRVLDWATLLHDSNWKDRLVRATQGAKLACPVYETVSSSAAGFVVSVAAGGVSASGFGSTKKAAEQQAAQRALGLLDPAAAAACSSSFSSAASGNV